MNADDTLCGVCYESYDTNDEDRITRLLPCSHSACHSCLGKLVKFDRVLRVNYLVCPECRKKHNVGNGVRRFPENRYILNFMKREKQQKRFKLCEEHDRDISLYCASCKENICQICMLERHVKHPIQDLVQKQKEIVDTRIDKLVTEIENYVDRYLTQENYVCDKYVQDVNLLRRVQKKLNETFENLIEEILNQKTAFRAKIDKRVSEARSHLSRLGEIRNLTNLKTETEVEVLMNSVAKIEQEQSTATEVITYKYLDYNSDCLETCTDRMSNVRGELVEKDMFSCRCTEVNFQSEGMTKPL